MATRVPLPAVGALPEMVLFHRDNPAEPIIVLQVPNADRTDSETYVLDLEHSDHAMWLDGLPFSRALKDALMLAPHIAYCPRTGHHSEVADLDEPSLAALAIMDARQQAGGSSPVFEKFFARRASIAPPVSRLRVALGSKMR
jgi:hypothetical protein